MNIYRLPKSRYTPPAPPEGIPSHQRRAIALGLPPTATTREIWGAEDCEMRRLLGLPPNAPLTEVISRREKLGLKGLGITLDQVRAAKAAKDGGQ